MTGSVTTMRCKQHFTGDNGSVYYYDSTVQINNSYLFVIRTRNLGAEAVAMKGVYCTLDHLVLSWLVSLCLSLYTALSAYSCYKDTSCWQQMHEGCIIIRGDTSVTKHHQMATGMWWNVRSHLQGSYTGKRSVFSTVFFLLQRYSKAIRCICSCVMG